MAAFLCLPTGSGLTLADIEDWASRARALGAADDAEVVVGEPPLADGGEPLTLSVPVNVSRTVLPDA
ncbi:hypothetical protein [Actinopolymorpha rutila]|uniref:Uncharacterized protein n=1 Tax=Actinopolymorpha rutila TaxID=446787 RepID=A0A852ZL83_9ACTN|nr:hypothetical protein [Actinopolymorpha rutila]NYH89156.1 hypothetical protein [Actinopolymorpha rutila]